METFQIPFREIKRRFTKSEIILMAWRSQEQHHNMKKKLKKYDSDEDEDTDETTVKKHKGKKRKIYSDGIGPERMPDEFYDENGDFNLSKVKGEQARRYFESVLKIPMPPGVTKIVPQDETSETIRKAYNIRR